MKDRQDDLVTDTSREELRYKHSQLIHHVKCWPAFFQDIKSGLKTFEIRLNDRGYEVGDLLCLHEFDPETNKYTGADAILCEITYMLSDERFLQKGYVCMAITPSIDPRQTEPDDLAVTN